MKRLGCGVLIAFLAVGILLSPLGLWAMAALGLAWARLLWREGRRIHTGYVYDEPNPAPPPTPVVVASEEPQVETFGNGAGHIVYPAGHVRRYEV